MAIAAVFEFQSFAAFGETLGPAIHPARWHLRSRQLDRIELTKQAEAVGDDPDCGDDAGADGENVDRAHLDIAPRRRDGPPAAR
jgi:hypothetical protein